MRAQFVNENIKFERGQDPKKGLNVGMDRKLPKKELQEVVVSKIWSDIKGDPFFTDKVDNEELRQELEQFVDVIIDEFRIERPSELETAHFREYWNDIFNTGPER
jgi:hypothetical protein